MVTWLIIYVEAIGNRDIIDGAVRAIAYVWKNARELFSVYVYLAYSFKLHAFEMWLRASSRPRQSPACIRRQILEGRLSRDVQAPIDDHRCVVSKVTKSETTSDDGSAVFLNDQQIVANPETRRRGEKVSSVPLLSMVCL